MKSLLKNLVGMGPLIAGCAFGLFLAAMPLMPFCFRTAELAAAPARWVITPIGLLISWIVAGICLDIKYIEKHGQLPPDF